MISNLSFISYLFISGLCMGIFYLYYVLFLRNKLNFRMNRYFLLSALLFSVVLPFMQINVSTTSIPNYETIGKLTEVKHVLDKQQENITPGLIENEPQNSLIYFPKSNNFLFILYLIIVAVLSVRFLTNLAVIILQIIRSPGIKSDHATLVLIDKDIGPYSFFNYIFINHSDYYSGENIDLILEHEKVHVKQFHSVDIVILEFIKIFLWFNSSICMESLSKQIRNMLPIIMPLHNVKMWLHTNSRFFNVHV